MRFFQAKVAIKRARTASDPARGQALFREFDREFLLFPFECIDDDGNDDSYWGLGQDGVDAAEEKTETFRVAIVSMEARVSEGRVCEAVERACDIWSGARVLACDIDESMIDGSVRSNRTRRRYVDEERIVRELDLTDVDFLLNRFSGKVLSESLAVPSIMEQCALARSSKTCYARSLSGQLRDLYRNEQGVGFVPVHYLIEGSTWLEVEEAVELLASVLHTTGRIMSTHIFSFDLDYAGRRDGASASWDFLERTTPALAKCFQGNVVIIRYGQEDTGDSYGERSYAILGKLLEEMRPYLDDTQLVFAVPPNRPQLEQRLGKMLGIPLVPIVRDHQASVREMSREQMVVELEARAAQDGMRAGERLERALDRRLSDASFDDLDGFYESWKHWEVIDQRFPEYREAVSSQKALLERPSAASALEELDDLIGLGTVKQQVKDIIARARMNERTRAAGLPVTSVSLHCVFLGEPGTGKTEVARLYARILKDTGILEEGRTITVSGAESWNVEKTFDRARGSVLFIDEAYRLLGNPDAIASLIALMENRRDDTVVILAGYEGHVNALLDSNPGFRSRIGFTLKFPNYSAEEKADIFRLMARKSGLALTESADSEMRDVLARAGARGDQGNARFVRKFFEDTVGAQQLRLTRECGDAAPTEEQLVELTEADVRKADEDRRARERRGPAGADDGRSGRERLAGLIGLSEVKGLIGERLDFARVQKARRDAGLPTDPIPMHLAFTGNPGTGKTEVARIVGQVLHEEGVLSVGDFYECGRQDLVSPLAGGSASKVAALFQMARGSVIFIDEAYSLMDLPGGPGEEAITALIDQMEKLRDEVVVILAGYTDEIERLLASNPGFSSRVATKIAFPDYGPDELVEIFQKMASESGLSLASGVAEKARGIFERAQGVDGFGNARFARNLLEDALLAQGSRLAASVLGDEGASDEGALQTLEPGDLSERLLEGLGRAKRGIGFLS